MLEICFDDHLGGELIFINRRKMREGNLWNDVLPIEFRLDCGNLNDGVFSENRFKYLKNISRDKWMGDEAFYTKKDWQNSQNALKTIKERVNAGEKILFWLSLNPKEVCDFLFLITEIDCFENMDVICFNDREVQRFSEVEYEKLQTTKIKLNEDKFNLISKTWNRICEGSHPLRVLINGAIVGVEEDFYDNIILSHIPDGEFVATMLFHCLYKANIKYGTHDFFTKRVCNILRSDKIEVLGWKPQIQSPLDLYEQIYKKK